MIGAKGMNSVRSSRALSVWLTSFSVAGASIDRLPSARGPNSLAPANKATIAPDANFEAISLAGLLEPEYLTPNCSMIFCESD